MTNSELVVHIDEELNKGSRDKLSNKVCHLNGVETAKLTSKRTHLMIVGYNSAQTRSMNILDGVRSTGVHAQLVGWL